MYVGVWKTGNRRKFADFLHRSPEQSFSFERIIPCLTLWPSLARLVP
jgi:hypothetical protein